MEKYMEKKIRKYVISTLSSPTLYLRKTIGKNEYFFTEDIEGALKTMTSTIAEEVLQDYYRNTGLNTELVIVPVEITYELIEE